MSKLGLVGTTDMRVNWFELNCKTEENQGEIELKYLIKNTTENDKTEEGLTSEENWIIRKENNKENR